MRRLYPLDRCRIMRVSNCIHKNYVPKDDWLNTNDAFSPTSLLIRTIATTNPTNMESFWTCLPQSKS